jgi:putative ABC transport system substrate-binding protein
VVARDYYDGGKEAAQLAVRIMRGESPASIPFQPLSKNKTIVNLAAARGAGLAIPETLLRKADKVIDK